MSTTPRTGKRAKRESRIDGRTTRHEGYRVSQVIHKLIETLSGDGKQHGTTIRQVKLRGQPKASDVFALSMLAVNLRRLPKLLEGPSAHSPGVHIHNGRQLQPAIACWDVGHIAEPANIGPLRFEAPPH
jgi:hypothetical protein